MSTYQAHLDGNCWPDSCPVCADECDGCGQWRHECVCPQLPLDDNEEAS